MFKSLNRKDKSFYLTVANIIKKINTNQSTLKKEIYGLQNSNRYYGILHNILLNYNLLKTINKKSDFMRNVPLGCVVISEVLNGNIKNAEYKEKFLKAKGSKELKILEDIVYIRLIAGISQEKDLSPYLYEMTEIKNVFKIFGFKDKTKNSSVKKDVVLNLEGKVKIQSFESCLPIHFLNPEKGSVVIDATAAPGNKTTQCYDAMNGEGKIFAFEKDSKRCELLKKMTEEYKCENITIENKDFLEVDSNSIKADYIVVDPSCSGSGIHFNYRKDNMRIRKLKNFQCMILNHALSFNPKKVVYSTCSVHNEEGEDVVQEALTKNPDYVLEKISLKGNENYKNVDDIQDKVIRIEKIDGIQTGFFVALLKRKDGK